MKKQSLLRFCITSSATIAVLTLAACNAVTPAKTPSAAPVRDQAARVAGMDAKIEALLAKLTLDEKISLVHANGKFSVAAVERLGIHETWLSDGPHGVREEISRDKWDPAGWTNDQATYLPPLTMVAASWDTEIAAMHGSVLGSEARHRNKDFILGPGANLARLPLYGRNFEYFGEDPLLSGKLAAAEIRAIQQNDVAATVKHYALNTQELNRIGVDNNPDERTLREIYLPAFEMSVKEGGVLSVMGGYNEYKGTNVNQSAELVNQILKDEWGFDGVLMTDWNVDINTYDAAMNGLDLEMGTDVADFDQYFFATPLKAQIEAGKIPESVLDEKVRRMLRVHFLIGKFDKYRLHGERNTHAHQQAAKAIAEAGIVLLKNDAVNGKKLLPLDKTAVKNVLLLGPNVDKLHGAGGGSSTVKALYEVSPMAGLKNALGEDIKLTYLRTRQPAENPPIDGIFVETRHWTGTPAWNTNFFESAKRVNQTHFDTVPDSAYKVTSGKTEYVSLLADIKPLASGEHQFKIQGKGKITLFVNGEKIASVTSPKGIYRVPYTFNEGERYAVRIDYDGKDQFLMGWDTPGGIFVSEEAAVAAAMAADTVIFVGGLSHGDDREAIDRPDMRLPGNQDSMLTKLLAKRPDSIVVMMAGSAVEMPWLAKANALVWSSYGGMEGGNALANILFGDINPSGKMPYTLPKRLEDTPAIALNDYNENNITYPEGVFMGYRWFDKHNIEPLFPFGFGLSYTDFSYGETTQSAKVLSGDSTLKISVEITNSGTVAGAEIVQLYVRDLVASVERPIRELKGFAKVHLAPGEKQRAEFELSPRDFSFWDADRDLWLLEPGEFEIHIGRSSRAIEKVIPVTWQ